MVATVAGTILQGFGNRFLADDFTVPPVEIDGLHLDQIDDPLEFLAGTNRQLQQDRIVAQFLAHLPNDAERVGSGAVHFVDERQTGNVVAIHLAVDGDRLGLDAADRAQNQDRPVQNAETTFYFDRKIHMSGGVDQINREILPLDGRGRAGDRDATLAFQFHVVHGRAAATAANLLHLVDAARVE